MVVGWLKEGGGGLGVRKKKEASWLFLENWVAFY
jgi:hypothetical protein